jgi:hypothetical protein
LYEFHGWFHLSEYDDDADEDSNRLFWRKRELVELLSRLEWAAGKSDVVTLNSAGFLRLHGAFASPAGQIADVDAILDCVSRQLPGSYGLLYERFDQDNAPTPPGRDAFRVRVMARGVVQVRLDPFLSPLEPDVRGDLSGPVTKERTNPDV